METLFDGQEVKSASPVTCLGMTFANDDERRAHFRGLLAKKLKDPAFRQVEGFPIGTDEAILDLSDPPYYCACPNPWIGDFVADWESKKASKPMGWKYERDPFAADVSEGKNDPIYNAHSYHTKVPPKAIMRYILHYTDPGDIVFDGFCGTGMTGVAAQLCGDAKAVRELGYKVDEATGYITDPNSDKPDSPISRLGARKCVLNDLSPAATFIAANYNSPVDVEAFRDEAERILAEVEAECGWMYETQHVVDGKGTIQRGGDGKPVKGKINYVVWSDVFVCPGCLKDVVFWEAAVDKEAGKVRDEFVCPHCGTAMTKRNSQRSFETYWDDALGRNVRRAKQVPVLINYAIGTKRFEKTPDEEDFALIRRIEAEPIADPFPIAEMPDGFNTHQPKISHGITHVHQFFTKRNLKTLAAFWSRIGSASFPIQLRQFVLGSLRILSKHAKHNKERRKKNDGLGWVNAGVSGTLYVSSCPAEQSVLFFFRKKLGKLFDPHSDGKSYCLSTTSSTAIGIPDCSIDFIFVDPPFGANLNYSELNYSNESWLGVTTDNTEEAIENDVQHKGTFEYRELMLACLKEAYRALKPGRWMTVEFSNTSAVIWNGIQSAIADAGFIVANVSALDKETGSFKAVTTPTAVKEDLVISAYKPDANFEARFQLERETEDGVWDFVRTHLAKVPVGKIREGALVSVPERDPRLIYDQVLAYYVRNNLLVPISAKEFQEGLVQRFGERDGMFFLPEQLSEYDRKKAKVASATKQEELFVCNEETAIAWLRARLREKPQTFQDINPDFMRQLTAWDRHETQLELKILLEENFLLYDGSSDVPPQIHAYLSTNWREFRNLPAGNPLLKAKASGFWYVPDPAKAADLEKMREKALLKEFEQYKHERKLKKFRIEVVRAGFRKAWEEKDYASILDVGAKVGEEIVNGDAKLLMWYNIAQRLGGK